MIEIDIFTQSLETLRNGGTLLFPTDTVWGIGCDATQGPAVEKIYHIKRRPRDKPMIVLAADIEMIQQYVAPIHPKIQTLLDFHVRPITIIYTHTGGLADNVCAQDQTIGIRIPQDDFCKQLIASFGKPIVATSANFSNEPFPELFTDIKTDLIQLIDYTVPYRQKDSHFLEPSAIVRLTDNEELEFLRK